MTEVVLVSMPFGPETSPSLGLSLLKAALAARGRPSSVLYFTIPFAETVGVRFYSQVSTDNARSVRELVGEWIFRRALFGSTPREDRAYVEEILVRRRAWPEGSRGEPLPGAMIARILAARERVDRFLDRCLAEVLSRRPKVLGFTSVFQQHVASLALAKRVKEASPGTVVVFGGANCEGIMGAETLRQFPFVDAVVSGEGEVVFPELVERALAPSPLDGLQGVRTRGTLEAEFARGTFPGAPGVARLDDLPEPDFSDYFEQFRRSRLSREWTPGLFFESSRGCWWGEKSQCTFCGLNGASIAYRSKSPDRALRELVRLAESHPGCDVQVVDNILDLGYFAGFLPALAERGLDLALFYETKANLRKEQVRLLAAAGIRRIQPGIESLSDPVLRLMRKGVTSMQNVQLLKWCKELGVRPFWNFLWGFPGEPAAEYERMAGLVPLLTHLVPPVGVAGLRLDRFSPNFDDAERMGFLDVAPLPSYRHVYPLPAEALSNLAYFFSYRTADRREEGGHVGALLASLRSWKRVAAASDVFSVDVGGRLLLWDLRPVARRPLTVLAGVERALYRACDAATELRALVDVARREGGPDGPLVTERDVEGLLAPLVEAGLVLRDGSRYLSLAVRLGDYSPVGRALERFWRTARRLGRGSGGRLVIPLGGSRAPARPRGRRGAAGRPAPAPSSRRASPRLTVSRFSLNSRGELVIN